MAVRREGHPFAVGRDRRRVVVERPGGQAHRSAAAARDAPEVGPPVVGESLAVDLRERTRDPARRVLGGSGRRRVGENHDEAAAVRRGRIVLEAVLEGRDRPGAAPRPGLRAQRVARVALLDEEELAAVGGEAGLPASDAGRRQSPGAAVLQVDGPELAREAVCLGIRHEQRVDRGAAIGSGRELGQDRQRLHVVGDDRAGRRERRGRRRRRARARRDQEQRCGGGEAARRGGPPHASSVARQRYQLATVRYGRQASPWCASSFGFGRISRPTVRA